MTVTMQEVASALYPMGPDDQAVPCNHSEAAAIGYRNDFAYALCSCGAARVKHRKPGGIWCGPWAFPDEQLYKQILRAIDESPDESLWMASTARVWLNRGLIMHQSRPREQPSTIGPQNVDANGAPV